MGAPHRAKSDAWKRTRSDALQSVAAPCATVWGVVLSVRFQVLDSSPQVSVRFSYADLCGYAWCGVVSCCGCVLRESSGACGETPAIPTRASMRAHCVKKAWAVWSNAGCVSAALRQKCIAASVCASARATVNVCVCVSSLLSAWACEPIASGPACEPFASGFASEPFASGSFKISVAGRARS